mmetsp:Transcript_35935/g.80369  ORF Transcript_35935/g.80369 Transcript_35935/m.80369 type:complete len:88 (+) Transcript_35935:1252-1515(+)
MQMLANPILKDRCLSPTSNSILKQGGQRQAHHFGQVPEAPRTSLEVLRVSLQARRAFAARCKASRCPSRCHRFPLWTPLCQPALAHR